MATGYEHLPHALGGDDDYVAQHATHIGHWYEGSLPVEPADREWKLSIVGLFGEPMSELRLKGIFTSGCINVGEVMRLCHRSQAMETRLTAYYMAIIGTTLPADKTRTDMRPHPILTINVDPDEIAWGAVTLAYLYWQLGMASRAGCLTLFQTWIYEYFPAFRPHPRQADMPNKIRAEMWSTPKLGREINKLRDCMTET